MGGVSGQGASTFWDFLRFFWDFLGFWIFGIFWDFGILYGLLGFYTDFWDFIGTFGIFLGFLGDFWDFGIFLKKKRPKIWQKGILFFFEKVILPLFSFSSPRSLHSDHFKPSRIYFRALMHLRCILASTT